MLLERYLDDLAAATMQEALGLEERPRALLRTTQDPKFGDYQINGAMALAKRLKKAPRDLAGPIAEAMAKHEAIAKADVAGPGFVNLTLDAGWLGRQLAAALGDARLGVDAVEAPEKIVVDFSSPNIAKQMHVGHLRSTIIGWSLVQLYRAVGHEVIGDNHLGDWGTQFGLLIVGMREFGDEGALEKDAIAELERVYKLASKKAKEDEAFAESARAELAKLQGGDPENTALWERFVATTRQTLEAIYARLGVRFDEWLGESAYDAMLPGVVETLLEKGIAREDQGAICVFFHDMDPGAIEGAVEGYALPKRLRKQKQPFIVRKKDGAFLYSTTDIATVLHRKEEMGADRSVYVVGAPQALHFEQLFAVMRLLGVEMGLEHVSFGSVLGEDGKPLKTRDGKTVKLKDLLDEAEQKTREIVEASRAEGKLRIAEEDLDEAVATIGIGAVKWADLMQNRATDYKYDPEKMCSFKGNAGPYVQYQYARVRSLFAEGGLEYEGFEAPIAPEHEAEVGLARVLIRFGDVVHRAAEGSLPNLICDHLYEVASAYSRFYTQCPVLKSEGETRETRLGLAALAGRQLEKGLELLGIEVLERM
ncbi:MAG TPA: arginine--tRNA ligase [Polyangiaceae bacterium LLY-WYZ-15_(1-7)]|nr:arginine--tRNA ligase [Myxococcales bacterium]MAT28991.1 arginine--tRNA ligase [Sandaracinus sp.]HJK89324.1 arginine--tRNA ligase [Polyangiaceae bacterium LLY-WYZ-15_(1-7)]HJL04218.1 arginine--tRNA ligase [Polyangiaceae bacterium LLY-WYZ-15_(1-7)]HJL08936.1 arginine--tRNA ligase [Polyangiaceae bacterium LLY-WYZ-15_(1-7)]